MPETKLYIRVKQALTWLKRNKGILQKDIADKMGMAEASFTRGLARCKEKNDEDFVISFHSVVSEYISLDYLLTGNGELVIQEKRQVVGTPPDAHTVMSPMDISILIEKSVEKATAYADKTISALEGQLAEKEKYIKLLEQKIELLEAMQHIDAGDIIHSPFPVGVADSGETTSSEYVNTRT